MIDEHVVQIEFGTQVMIHDGVDTVFHDLLHIRIGFLFWPVGAEPHEFHPVPEIF